MKCETCDKPLKWQRNGQNKDAPVIGITGPWDAPTYTLQCWDCPVPEPEVGHYEVRPWTISHIGRKSWADSAWDEMADRLVAAGVPVEKAH
ncbi:MAG: hypothetical protein M3132_03445 [Actinomycetia bacterium]|nr:hypothetical protein [Actinomycetes bacterium]